MMEIAQRPAAGPEAAAARARPRSPVLLEPIAVEDAREEVPLDELASTVAIVAPLLHSVQVTDTRDGRHGNGGVRSELGATDQRPHTPVTYWYKVPRGRCNADWRCANRRDS